MSESMKITHNEDMSRIVERVRRQVASGISVIPKRVPPPSMTEVEWSRTGAAEYLDHRLTPEGELEHLTVLAEAAFRDNDIVLWRRYKHGFRI